MFQQPANEMPVIGSSSRPFFEEVQAMVDILNLTTLKRRNWTNIFGIIRISIFFSIVMASLILCYFVFIRYYEGSEDSDSMRYLSFTFLGSWLVIVHNLIEFSGSTVKLRSVIALVSKVDSFLLRSKKLKKSRLSYFRTLMVLKYIVFVVLGLADLYIQQRNFTSRQFIVLKQAGIFSLCFLVDLSIRKFTIMVHFIERRLKVLKDMLKDTWIHHDKGWQHNVKALNSAHDLLCDACVLINWALRRSLVTLICLIFSRLVHIAVTTSIEVKRNGSAQLEVIELIYVTTYWLWNLFDITHYTQQCECQVNGFNSTLYGLVMSNTQIRSADSDFVDSLFIQLGRKRQIAFTAHGLFRINNTLVHTVIAGVFTTVIIILQTDEN